MTWRTPLLWGVVTTLVWVVMTLGIAVFRVLSGRATGIALRIPPFLISLPKVMQIALAVFGAPFVVGAIAGMIWAFIRRD